MYCTAIEAYNNVAQNTSNHPQKLVKNKNVDLKMTCALLDKHERFNQNTNVSWWFRKACKGSCWNPEDEDWTEIDCSGSCKTSLHINDDNASNGFYLCRMFPYNVNDQTTLQIEVTKAFQLEINGESSSHH